MAKKKRTKEWRPIRAKKKNRLLYKTPERNLFDDSDDWEEWKATVYYQWWDYLRAHEGYKKTCEAGGKGEFANLYEDFGDIRRIDFPTWMKKRGLRLFREPIEGIFAKNMDAHIQMQLRERVDPDYPVWAIIAVPLHIPAKRLGNTITEFIRTEQKKHKIDIKRVQPLAKYRPHGSAMRLDAYERTLRVWRIRKENPNLTYWEIGLKVGHVPSEPLDLKNKPNLTQRQQLTNLVARDLKNAEKRLQFVGQGEFPRTK